MQWLIDLITERVRQTGMYVNRGDPSSYDFQIGDLTVDGGWHEMDLSSIIPVDANLVNIVINIQSNVAGRHIQLRTMGNVNVRNRQTCYAQVANRLVSFCVPVTPGGDRKIDYKVSNGFTPTINVVVAGWWF